MASFEAKIGGKMPRKREYKKYRSVSFLLDEKQKIPKNSKKIKKVKKYHYCNISGQNWLENAEKERISKVSFRFVPTRREIENPKKIAKKFKNLKNAITASFQPKIGWKRMRKRENRNCHSVPFPTRNRKFQKIQQKNTKN